jgi:hypothetical protein
MLPTDYAARKEIPIATGVLDYFPLAIAEIAKVSKVGNDQHSPGQPLHWARGKSTNQADTLMRHFLERGGMDVDGQRHSAKMAWRALALLQTELELAQGIDRVAEAQAEEKAAAKPPRCHHVAAYEALAGGWYCHDCGERVDSTEGVTL